MTIRVDIAIVGGGIAGASAGYHLAGEASVLLLEREERCGYHATGRSAASFTENYGSVTVRRIAMAGRDFLLSPPAGFSDTPLTRPRGLMTIARQDQLSLLRPAFERARALLPQMRLLDGEEARALVPILRPEAVAAAMLEPSSLDIEVAALHQGFLRGLRQQGGQIRTAIAVRRLAPRAGGWCIETDGEDIEAEVVVDAAGAWADEIAGLAGVAPLGLTPLRRTAFLLDLPAGQDPAAWPLVDDIGAAFYFKPDAGRLLASPSDETPSPPCDAQPDELDLAIGVDRIEQATSLQVRHLPHRWAGLRTFAPDRSPVAGFDPAARGFFWLAGQGGYGIKTSRGLGLAAAGLILRRALPDALLSRGVTEDELSPRRFRATETRNPEEPA